MPSAEITLREVYDVVVEVRSEVTSMKAEFKSTQGRVQDHETRIRAVERWIWGAAGVGVVGGAGISQILTALIH